MSAVKLIKPRRFSDQRGWFAEVYSERNFAEIGVNTRFVQDNQSFSALAGTVRGLHFQGPPHAQAKLVRCIAGCVMDVAVDIRSGSPTFGQWVAAELSAQNGYQLYIPIGFAHGFATLQPNTEIIYKVSDFYAPDCDFGIRWDDPTIAVRWPDLGQAAVISTKDAVLPYLTEIGSPFCYDGEPLAPLAK